MVSPILTPLIGGGLSPRVEVVLDAPGGAVASATFTRRDGDRVSKVRGGVRRSVVGGVAIVDREAGFGVPLTYRAEFFDAAGVSVGFSDSATTVLPFSGVIVSVPLEPSLWMEWLPTESFSDGVEWKSPGARYLPQSANRPSWVGPRRTSPEAVDLSGAVLTVEQFELFRSFFGSDDVARMPVLLWRASPEFRLPSSSFFAQTDVNARHVGSRAMNGRSLLQVSGAEVQPPAPGLVEALLTWDDVAAFYKEISETEGWDAAASDNADWLALSRRYDLVGYAEQ